jgi:predicted ABC-class ATPase
MKLLFQTTNRVELDGIRMRLESVGIPVFIGNEDSARNFGLIMPARSFACWIPIEDQYEDAVKFLNDESHVVESAVDVGEYYKAMELYSSDFVKSVVEKLLLAIVIFVVVSLSLLAIFNG